jgi:hypothetical protein
MSTFALQVAIAGVSSLQPHVGETFFEVILPVV